MRHGNTTGRVALAMFLMLFVMSGCAGKKVDLAAVEDSLLTVCERHDTYVEADPKLSPVEKSVALRTSALLVKTVETAKGTSYRTAPDDPNASNGVKVVGTMICRDGRCDMPAKGYVLSTDELANKNLYFTSKGAMNLYLESNNRPHVNDADVKAYDKDAPTTPLPQPASYHAPATVYDLIPAMCYDGGGCFDVNPNASARATTTADAVSF